MCSPALGGVLHVWVWRSPGGGESDHPIRNRERYASESRVGNELVTQSSAGGTHWLRESAFSAVTISALVRPETASLPNFASRAHSTAFVASSSRPGCWASITVR